MFYYCGLWGERLCRISCGKPLACRELAFFERWFCLDSSDFCCNPHGAKQLPYFPTVEKDENRAEAKPQSEIASSGKPKAYRKECGGAATLVSSAINFQKSCGREGGKPSVPWFIRASRVEQACCTFLTDGMIGTTTHTVNNHSHYPVSQFPRLPCVNARVEADSFPPDRRPVPGKAKDVSPIVPGLCFWARDDLHHPRLLQHSCARSNALFCAQAVHN